MGRPRKRVTKTCEQCGIEFEVQLCRSTTARFCSHTCDGKFHTVVRPPSRPIGRPRDRVIITCEICGKQVEVPRSQSAKRFCSRTCHGKAQAGVNNPAWSNAYREFICSKCGVGFFSYQCLPNRYCSIACKNASLRVAKVTKHCLKCGGEYSRIRSQADKSRYCSLKCMHSHDGHYAKVSAKALDSPTDIEVIMAGGLQSIGLNPVQQVPLGRFVCDFMLREHHLIIECDGDYWHNLPQNIKRDRRKADYFRKCGFTLLRFTGTQIKSDISHCLELVKQNLQA